MLRRSALALCAPLFLVSAASAAEPILGTWRVENGETVTYSACGTAFCATVDTGRYKGKSLGRVSGTGGRYTGSVVDPSNDKTYEGRAEVSGNILKLTGCVAKVFCQTRTWTR
ncbi:DUF2147 domain-containing protein [Aureimonas pseudogalii]|uniref:Uncharacterized protein (DUF2147 family) n=1 Tax=Aureimonas pseudogalii TaxID=1744844 RepID=A0A7W6EE53_9HYPH|nr:DUF2147 domain-containing protein [Aureimonas pseudogalii]MBB3996538.1 uncharacterized protein (DUF2147 family) [Aureimonas pseudogalii]